MKYRIQVTIQAKEDLIAIYEYIAIELLSPEYASGQIDRIESAILDLEEMPFRYRLFSTEPWNSKGVRIMSVDHYVVIYIPDKNAGTVTVLRVMYGGRDIKKQLDDNTVFPFNC